MVGLRDIASGVDLGAGQAGNTCLANSAAAKAASGSSDGVEKAAPVSNSQAAVALDNSSVIQVSADSGLGELLHDYGFIQKHGDIRGQTMWLRESSSSLCDIKQLL